MSQTLLPEQSRRPPNASAIPAGLVTLAAGALVVAALVLARDLLVPLVLAVLLGFVLAPLVKLLTRVRLPRAVAVLVAVLLAMAGILTTLFLVSQQLAQLAANLPAYQRAIEAKLEGLHLNDFLADANGLLRGLGGSAAVTGPGGVPRVGQAPARAAPAEPEASSFEVVRSVAEPLLEPLATAGIVIVFTIFVLLYREDLRDRLVRLAGARDLHRTVLAMNDAASRLSRFFLAQVGLNAAFGLIVGVALWALGLPNPPLWGLLAALMRFVPFIGVFVAVVPPTLLGLAVDPNWGLALSVLAMFVISEAAMGQVVEPLVYGRSTGLSPVSIILSATFWAFLWGPVGLLLATPLTVCLVVLGRHVERLAFLDIMLGDRPPLAPEESFYQSALAGDADTLVAQTRRRLKDESLAAWSDAVALGGLALAQADWSREVLDPDRLGTIRQSVETLLDDLAESAEPEALDGLPDDWRADGAILCLGARGPFDDLAATLAAEALRRAGFGVTTMANTMLDAGSAERLDPARVRVCLLSVLEEGNSAAGVRFFLRRLRRRLPGARIAVALWRAPAESLMVAALRDAGEDATQGEPVVTSIGEALALCTALATPGEVRSAA